MQRPSLRQKKRHGPNSHRDKAVRWLQRMAKPVNQGGGADAEGWTPLDMVANVMREVAKRPVSPRFLRNVIVNEPSLELSDDGKSVRAVYIDGGDNIFGTPKAVMFAPMTAMGLEALRKTKVFSGMVYEKQPSGTSTVIKVNALRAESFGAKFYVQRGRDGLLAENVSADFIFVLKQTE